LRPLGFRANRMQIMAPSVGAEIYGRSHNRVFRYLLTYARTVEGAA